MVKAVSILFFLFILLIIQSVLVCDIKKLLLLFPKLLFRFSILQPLGHIQRIDGDTRHFFPTELQVKQQ